MSEFEKNAGNSMGCVSREPQTQSCINQLQAQTEQIVHLAEELEKRLHAVLMERKPENGLEKKESEELVPVASSIRSQCIRLAEAGRTIESILSRLEV